MKEHKYTNRTALLEIIMEKKFSLSTENEIMHLFKNIEPSKKEEIAKAAIPLVKNSKTEQEALQKIKELINEKAG